MVRPVPMSRTGSPLARKILHRFACRAAPRIADETIADAREGAERFGFLVTDGKHQRPRFDSRPVVELNCPAPVLSLRSKSRGGNCFRAATGHRFVEDFAQIPPEQPPLNIIAAIAAFGLYTSEQNGPGHRTRRSSLLPAR